jgi:hypothetical protein
MTDVQRRAATIRRRESADGVAALASLGEPNAFARQHAKYETSKVKDPKAPAARLVKRNITRLSIDRYHSLGWLSDRQHRAATRYLETYERSGFERSTTSRYDGGTGGNANGPNQTGILAATHAQIDARAAFRLARAALPSSLASRFDLMVLHGDAAQDIGSDGVRTDRVAAQLAIEWIRIGCDELANFYRL